MLIRQRDNYTTVPTILRNIDRIVPSQAERLEPIAVLYKDHATAQGLHWSWLLAQSMLETDYGRSSVCRSHRNWAGIKPGPYGDNTSQYRKYLTDEAGVIDHVSLMAVYCGIWVPGMVDPTRNERLPTIIEAHHIRQGRPGVPYVLHTTELNGLWAVPGDNYAQNITRAWVELVA